MKTLDTPVNWATMAIRAFRHFQKTTTVVEESLYPTFMGPNFYFPNSKIEGGEQFIFSESVRCKNGKIGEKIGIIFKWSTRDGWNNGGKFFSVSLVEVIPLSQYYQEKHGYNRFHRHLVTLTYVHHNELGLMRFIDLFSQEQRNSFDSLEEWDKENVIIQWFLHVFLVYIETGKYPPGFPEIYRDD